MGTRPASFPPLDEEPPLELPLDDALPELLVDPPLDPLEDPELPLDAPPELLELAPPAPAS